MGTLLHPVRAARICSILIALSTPAVVCAAVDPPDVSASVSAEAPSEDGTFELEWGDAAAVEGRAEWTFHVQIAAPPDPETFIDWYRGPALHSFVSGIPSGEARARVRARRSESGPWSPWSEPVVIPVRHHAMSKALGLMALGSAVFATICGFVGIMAWRTRHGDEA